MVYYLSAEERVMGLQAGGNQALCFSYQLVLAVHRISDGQVVGPLEPLAWPEFVDWFGRTIYDLRSTSHHRCILPASTLEPP